MPGRFRLYTDTDIDGPVVKALQRSGWDILRGIDVYPEKTADDVHFARAAQEWRALVSNDHDMKTIATAWYAAGRSFLGLVWWPRSHHVVMSPGDFVAAFEELAALDEPVTAYPIIHIKPKR